MKTLIALIGLTASFSLLVSNTVLAQTKIELDGEKTIKAQRIRSGAIEVEVNYQPFKLDGGQADYEEENNLSYRIFHNKVEKVNEKTSTYFTGKVSLQDLDKNGTPEAIIETFTGGAHCCTAIQIYALQNNRFAKHDLGLLDGGGGQFKDLDGDGKIEFVTLDNSFFYQFSSYAGSYPPSLILAFENGKFKNVTRRHPKELRSHAWGMYQAFVEHKKESNDINNGVLAGYVAQKILLGEYQEGWNFMLANYNRKSEEGLEVYKDDKLVRRYPNFPAALKAFLIEQGYLDKQGRPSI